MRQKENVLVGERERERERVLFIAQYRKKEQRRIERAMEMLKIDRFLTITTTKWLFILLFVEFTKLVVVSQTIGGDDTVFPTLVKHPLDPGLYTVVCDDGSAEILGEIIVDDHPIPILAFRYTAAGDGFLCDTTTCMSRPMGCWPATCTEPLTNTNIWYRVNASHSTIDFQCSTRGELIMASHTYKIDNLESAERTAKVARVYYHPIKHENGDRRVLIDRNASLDVAGGDVVCEFTEEEDVTIYRKADLRLIHMSGDISVDLCLNTTDKRTCVYELKSSISASGENITIQSLRVAFTTLDSGEGVISGGVFCSNGPFSSGVFSIYMGELASTTETLYSTGDTSIDTTTIGNITTPETYSYFTDDDNGLSSSGSTDIPSIRLIRNQHRQTIIDYSPMFDCFLLLIIVSLISSLLLISLVVISVKIYRLKRHDTRNRNLIEMTTLPPLY